MKTTAMICTLAALTFTLALPAHAAKRKPASKTTSASTFFVSPKNGETVTPKFKVKFGIKGIKIRPAGEDVADKKSGHHHLIIDGMAIAEGQPVPTDDTHKHFGKGQTETELELAPGVHSLTLQFADGAHLSYGPKLSQTINIEVK
jgi:hypothetical protein